MEIEAVLEIVKAFGQIGLFFYSIIETITPLAGVEVIFIFLIRESGGMWWNSWWFTAFTTTVANAVGAIIVYFFMAKEDNWIARRFISKEARVKAEAIFKKYGHWAIFIFAMTPLPFFVILFIAAFSRMNFKSYLVATILSRGFRFFVTTFIINFFVGIDVLQMVLILITISLPISAVMYFAEKKITKKLDIEKDKSIP
jgi:membrane protein YqaA with SNARE-associated domain